MTEVSERAEGGNCVWVFRESEQKHELGIHKEKRECIQMKRPHGRIFSNKFQGGTWTAHHAGKKQKSTDDVMPRAAVSSPES